MLPGLQHFSMYQHNWRIKKWHIGRLLPKIGRLLPRIGKFISEESEGFFRRALGSYTHKFPKRGAASLTYLPRSRLDLPRSRLGLLHLRLSRNSGPATEGFSNRSINFKDAYRNNFSSAPTLRSTTIAIKLYSVGWGLHYYLAHRELPTEQKGYLTLYVHSY